MRTSSSLALCLFLAACAGSNPGAPAITSDGGAPLNIAQPPSGSLTATQLATVAADIRRLEARPLAPDHETALRHLLGWLAGSPDVSVTMCGGVTGPLTDSNSPYATNLLMQHTFSSAAYLIDNPGADRVAINVGGFEGALRAYEALRALAGDGARDAFMDRVAARQVDGELEAFVRDAVADCGR